MSNAIRIAPLLLLLLLVAGGEVSAGMSAEGDINAEGIPYKTEPAGPAGGLSRVIGALVLCLLVIVLVAYLLRRFTFKTGRGIAGGRIATRAARRITPHITAFVIAVDDREYLLMQSRNGLHVIEHTGRPEALETE